MTKTAYNLSFIALVIATILPVGLVDHTVSFPPSDQLPIILLAINVALALCGLYRSCRNYPFSLQTAHWTFNLFFLAIAPFVQLVTNRDPRQADLGFFREYTVAASLLVMIWNLIALAIYPGPPDGGFPPKEFPESQLQVKLVSREWLMVLVSAASVILLVSMIGIGPLFYRAEDGRAYELSSSKPLTQLVESICRAVPLICTYLLLQQVRYKPLGVKLAAGLVAVLTIIVSFPTAIARFGVGTIVLAFCCLLAKSRARNGLWMPFVFTIGLLLILPIGNLTRNVSQKQGLSSIDFSTADFGSGLTGGDFDAYAMLVNTTWYIDHNPPSYGANLLGNTLFFIPREWWPEKPRGSPNRFLTQSALKYFNLSEPLIAEAMMNFGLLGVPLYCIVFCLAIKRLDQHYWTEQEHPRSRFSSVFTTFYPFSFGLTFFLCRGDYLNSFAYMAGFLATVFLVVYSCVAVAKRNPGSPPATRPLATRPRSFQEI